MKIKELKEFVKTIPDSFDESEVVIRTYKSLDNDHWCFYDEGVCVGDYDTSDNEFFFGGEKVRDKWDNIKTNNIPNKRIETK